MVVKLLEKIFFIIFLAFSYLKKLFFKVRRAFARARIRSAQNSWYISRNYNYYNSVIKATVFGSEKNWTIVRFGNYFNGFKSKQEAMDKAFKIWLKDSSLESYLAEVDLEHNIANKYRLYQKEWVDNYKYKTKNHRIVYVPIYFLSAGTFAGIVAFIIKVIYKLI